MPAETTTEGVERAFAKDVADHRMVVRSDDGTTRHLSFRSPGSPFHGFDIVTWAGHLCITGDVGSYVFCRETDMFEFFRASRGINPSYWAEKLVAHDRVTGHVGLDLGLYRDEIAAEFALWKFDSDEQRANSWEWIECDDSGILHPWSTSEAVKAARDYCCPVTDQGFGDFTAENIESYRHQFLWCCLAIRWAIDRYDETKVLAEAA